MTNSLKDIDTLIFDFDGTIADTLKLGIKVSNQLANKYGYKRIESDKALEEYRNLSTKNALKKAGVKTINLPFIANSFRTHMAERIDELKPIKAMPEAVKLLAENYKIGIVTSNSEKNTKQFLDTYQIDEYINYYSTGIHLLKKYRTINKLLKQHGITKDKVILIGDETRDVDASKKCGIPIISVSWGFHTPKILHEQQPDYLVHTPQELVQLLSA